MAEQAATTTPPKLAQRWGVKPETILRFIRTGELRAFDVSRNPGVGRPRYRIPLDAIVEFENRRAAKPPTVVRRSTRKQSPNIIQFF